MKPKGRGRKMIAQSYTFEVTESLCMRVCQTAVEDLHTDFQGVLSCLPAVNMKEAGPRYEHGVTFKLLMTIEGIMLVISINRKPTCAL